MKIVAAKVISSPTYILEFLSDGFENKAKVKSDIEESDSNS